QRAFQTWIRREVQQSAWLRQPARAVLVQQQPKQAMPRERVAVRARAVVDAANPPGEFPLAYVAPDAGAAVAQLAHVPAQRTVGRRQQRDIAVCVAKSTQHGAPTCRLRGGKREDTSWPSASA